MSDWEDEGSGWAEGPTDKPEEVSKSGQLGFLDPSEPAVKPQEKGWNPTEKDDYDLAFDLDKDRSDKPQWSSQARKYEFKDEYGEVGPEDEELEHELFVANLRPKQGIKFDIIQSFKVDAQGPKDITPIHKLDEAGFHPVVLQNLRRSGFEVATPIQAFTVPAALAGHDILGTAQTGSGKTVAYLAPAVSRLMGKADQLTKPKPNPELYDQRENGITAEPLVLIIVPTRELALQIYDDARRLCYRSKLRPCVIYGGGPKAVQKNDLMRGCDVLIATPGRLVDLLGDAMHPLALDRIRYVVFDEADEMMDDDWEQELSPVLSGLAGSKVQYMMFSATFGARARETAKSYMNDQRYVITVGRVGSSHSNIIQYVVFVEDDMKMQAAADLMMSLPPSRTIIFCSSVHRAAALDNFLYRAGFPTTILHGKLTQRERESAMQKFRAATSPILVTTTVSARGLDIENVAHVINYDLPSQDHGGIGAYAHVIGRTGRIGNVGQASSFYNDRNSDIAGDLAKLLLETGHTVPDFLESYAPPDGVVTWEEETIEPAGDDQGATGAGDTDDAWGSGSWGDSGAQQSSSKQPKDDFGAGASSITAGMADVSVSAGW